MTDDRTAKKLQQRDVREPRQLDEAQRADAKAGGKPQRKPSKIERREWRGAGVCGDRHTD